MKPGYIQTKSLFLITVLIYLVTGAGLNAQITEKFSDHANGDKTFSQGGLTFSATGNLEVDYRAGWGLDDDYFISNFGSPVSGGGTVGSFSNSGSNFNVHELYIIPLNASELVEQYNNIQIIGKLDGGTQFTHTIQWDSFNMNASPNNYYTYVNLSSYSSHTLDQLQFVIEPYGDNDIKYLMIDDFKFEADASLPVELVSFSATGNNNAVDLQWTTASESDNLGFILERKTDNADYQQIASYQSDNALTGNGTTSSPSQYSYTDAKITAGESYTYRLSDVDCNGEVTVVGSTSVATTALPTSTQLFSAYPNPFNPSTNLKYQLVNDSHVTLAVYNVLGRQIKMLVNQQQTAGEYSVQWDGMNNAGVSAPSGTYLVRLQANGFNQVQKILYIK